MLQRARWDEERDAWALASPEAGAPRDGPALHARRPSATPGALRPTCAWARAAAASGAPRFLAENILALERDVPARPALRFGDAGAQVRAFYFFWLVWSAATVRICWSAMGWLTCAALGKACAKARFGVPVVVRAC